MGRGHERGGFVAGEAEHEALIAGAAHVHALADVRALRVNATIDLARIRREADLVAFGLILRHIADLADDIADEFVHGFAREVRLGRDFAGHHGEVRRHERFAGHPAHGIGRQAVIEDGIADLVRHLVRVAHRHGFTRE